MASSASPEEVGKRSVPIVILGAGGHARVVLDTCRAAGLGVSGLVDPVQPDGTMLDGARVLGTDALLADREFLRAHHFVPGVGSQAIKRRLCEMVLAAGGALGTVVHPSAVISPSAQIGAGSVVVAGAVVNARARVGRFCILNTRAAIDHDCELADGVQVSPGAILCGGVNCAEDVFVGAGAILLPGRTVGVGAVIGAGAVVTKDVGDNLTVAGNPAQTVRR